MEFSRHTVATLWGGIGGGMLGFVAVGFRPLWGCDDRPFVRERDWKRSWSGVLDVWYSEEDIEDPPLYVADEKLGNLVDKPVPDVLIGSPPCKSFSSLAVRKKDRTDIAEKDPRQLEYVRFLQCVAWTRPKVFVLENLRKVNDYIAFDHNKSLVISARTGEALVGLDGYDVSVFPRINAKDYGVPQNRNRLFWVGVRKDVGVAPTVFGQEERGENVRDAFVCLDEFTPNMELPKHSAERTAGFAALKPGQSYYGTQNNKRIHWGKIGPTITSHRTQYVHPSEPRVLTVRETARIMGFPDDFIFYGPRTKQYDQVGCGISPRLAEALAVEIKRILAR